ncbi:hypothetical protein HDU98_004447 [Podochytrium sp. JEL0797]|nr:hypothetical protein HDU98_004447 [Podochytrium sp. JEL0797]
MHPFVVILLSALFQVISADQCGNASSIFVFDPPSLDYNSALAGATFTVAMAFKPNQTVQAALNLQGFTFSTPLLSFNEKNWNITQQVALVAPVSLSPNIDTANINIEIDINAPCNPSIHQCALNYPIKYTPVSGLVCTVSGDPQVTSFNSFSYTEATPGNFYYFKNKYLEVEGFLYNCNDGIVCLGAVSVRYGDAVLLINGYQVGPTDVVSTVSPDLHGLTYSGQIGADRSLAVTITTQDGTTIIVNDIKFASGPYDSHMNVVITLSSLFAATANTGKCTNSANSQQDWPVDPSDNHMNGAYTKGACVYPLADQNVAAAPNGPGLSFYPGMSFNATSYTNVCTIIEVLVPPPAPPAAPALPPFVAPAVPILVPAAPVSASLIPAAAAATTALALTQPASPNAPVVSAVSVSAATLASPAIPTPPNAPAVPVVAIFNQSAFSPADMLNAQDQCNQILQVNNCDNLPAVNLLSLQTACMKDILLTNSHNYTDSHLQVLHILCANSAQSILNCPIQSNLAIAAPAAAVQAAAGYGANACPNSCSGNGACSQFGCACRLGFSGVDCSVVLASLPLPAVYQPAGLVYVPTAIAQAVMPAYPAGNVPAAAIAAAIAANPVAAPSLAPVAPVPVASGVPVEAAVGISAPAAIVPVAAFPAAMVAQAVTTPAAVAPVALAPVAVAAVVPPAAAPLAPKPVPAILASGASENARALICALALLAVL